jgi:uncharacterized protein (DUF1778 family)
MLSKNMNIRISEKEYAVIKAFADFRGESISSLILGSIRAQIEDWEDIRDAEEILSRKEQVYSWDDVKKRAGL